MKNIKKILYLTLFFFIVIFVFKEPILKSSTFSFIFSSLPDSYRSVLLSIFSNSTTTKKIKNDKKTYFLPKTQLLNLNFKKIKLPELENEGNKVGYGINKKIRKSFYIKEYDDQVYLATKKGTFYSFESDNLNQRKIDLQKINTNLKTGNDLRILSIFILKDKLYLSAALKKDNNCEILIIKKASLLNETLNFINVIDFKECAKIKSIQAGKLAGYIDEQNIQQILLSTNIDETSQVDKNYLSVAQQNKSIFGKILIINSEKEKYEIFSKGHRNVLGLYSNNSGSVVISTENGPKGGDEINLIKRENNYGWNIASYGERYDSKGINKSPHYKKNHEDYNYKEPVYAFVPSIAPTSIIRLEDNFSPLWKKNFLVGTLVYQTLLRVKFSNDFAKVILVEDIFIGERIRDLIYLENKKIILMALENSGSIGILKNY